MSGLRAWLVQRLSAIYMLGFIVFLLAHFLVAPRDSYQSWHDWVLGPSVSVAFLLFFAALFLHAWVGLRDVILDYIRPLPARIAALVCVGIGLAAMAGWIIRILVAR